MVLPEDVDLLPSSVAVFTGKTTVIALPASATGGGGLAFTIMVTEAVALILLLSVTFNSKVYSPSARPLTVVAADVAFSIAASEGPESCVHS